MKRKALAALGALLVCVLCCGCAARANLSGEQAAALRGQYPCVGAGVMQLFTAPELEGMAGTTAAVAVVEVTGGWESRTFPSGVLGLPTTGWELPVKVKNVLYSAGDISRGSDLRLYFASAPGEQQSAYRQGERYVCLICTPGELAGRAVPDGAYLGACHLTAYLTPDRYLMSMTEAAPLARYTGWTLEAFAAEVESVLGK